VFKIISKFSQILYHSLPRSLAFLSHPGFSLVSP